MNKIVVLCSIILFTSACKRPPTFSQKEFIESALHHQLLDEKELSYVALNLETISNPKLRIVASFAKKANFKNISHLYQLDSVNIDSNFSMVKFFREQLSFRANNTSKPIIILKANQRVKENATLFYKEIFEKNMITAAQYAKLQEQLKQEPVVFPFVVYEWLEMMP